MSFKKTLASIVILSSLAMPQQIEGKSILDYLIFDRIKARKVAKAEKQLIDYAADGELTAYEVSQVLKIVDNKDIRKKITLTEYNLKKEAETRRRAEEVRRREVAKQENDRKESIASHHYKSAMDAYKREDYTFGAAKYLLRYFFGIGFCVNKIKAANQRIIYLLAINPYLISF